MQQFDFLSGYCKLTRIALNTDCSQMDVPTHQEFCTILDRAQQILRLEALQSGLPDPRELPMYYWHGENGSQATP
jgi:hypothetical protein